MDCVGAVGGGRPGYRSDPGGANWREKAIDEGKGRVWAVLIDLASKNVVTQTRSHTHMFLCSDNHIPPQVSTIQEMF